jgi:hypothetical protein
MPSLAASCNDSKGKRKASADRVSENSSVAKYVRIELPVIIKAEGPATKEQKIVAAKRVQRFWRRCCMNTLYVLVKRMIDQNINTNYVKSIRFIHYCPL